MLTGSTLRDPIFINTVGHTTGLLLFGLTILLLIRDRQSQAIRQTRLSIAAAALAFAWNFGSLIALIAFRHSSSIGIDILMAVTFSALSLLPAVLLQLELKGTRSALVYAGYGLSFVAVCLHLSELFLGGSLPHQAALLLLAVGFGLISTIALFTRPGRDDVWGHAAQWLPFACLLLFTSSFPHFGYRHIGSPWAAEIAWHHVGIPVVLIVLMRDYRFLLLDTFIRFLLNSLLAAGFISCVLFFGRHWQIDRLVESNQVIAAFVLVAFGISLVSFAQLKTALQSWISRVVFRRQNLDEKIRRIVQLPSQVRTEDELLSEAAALVASHFRADRCAVVSEPNLDLGFDRPVLLWDGDQGGRLRSEFAWAEVCLPLRFSSVEPQALLTGARTGRQRYLSEDLEDMSRLGAAIVEQVERFRSDELKRLAAKAELRALQAQINPHFLFNALNTLYGTIDRRSHEARRLVLNLADIFRYFLQGDRVLIPLSEELRIIQAYLEIEALRLGDRLQTEITVSDNARLAMIPALLIQPLVENAVKHGVAANPGPGTVRLSADIVSGELRVIVEDTGGGFAGRRVSSAGSGTGLENVRRRLNLSYGAQAKLEIHSSLGGSRVSFQIPEAAIL